MKKILVIVFICSISIFLLWYILSNTAQLDIHGRILISTRQEDNSRGISIYDIRQEEISDFIPDGTKALFISGTEVLIQRFDTIVKYNLETSVENIIYESSAPIDSFEKRTEQEISISSGGDIILYNIYTKKNYELLSTEGIDGHSWSCDGVELFYSNENIIISYNILSGEKKEICAGRFPKIASNSRMAYTTLDNNLVVRDLRTQEIWEYSGSNYYYAFSPNGNYLLIEDEMTAKTGIKNLFLGKRILGHRIIVWDYYNKKQKTLIDACEAGTGESFFWQ